MKLKEKDAKTLLLAISRNQTELVVENLEKDSDLLFKKATFTTDFGQTFHGVSPLQLMIFLCDGKMLNEIKSYIPKKWRGAQGGLLVEFES